MPTSTQPTQPVQPVQPVQQPRQPLTFEQIQAFCQTNQNDVCVLFNTQLVTANIVDTDVKNLEKLLKPRLDFLSVAGIVEIVLAVVLVAFAAWAYKKRKELNQG